MNPYIGEIRIVGFGFTPSGWAPCDGRLLAITEHTALFSIIGTMYGGDGRTNFAVPDLRGRVALHAGAGQGLSPYSVGQTGGQSMVPLSLQQMGPHSHQLQGSTARGGSNDPVGNLPAQEGSRNPVYTPLVAPQRMSGDIILPAGESRPHDNSMPSLCMTYVIALQGLFPPRN